MFKYYVIIEIYHTNNVDKNKIETDISPRIVSFVPLTRERGSSYFCYTGPCLAHVPRLGATPGASTNVHLHRVKTQREMRSN
jgi:hypothetical protein